MIRLKTNISKNVVIVMSNKMGMYKGILSYIVTLLHQLYAKQKALTSKHSLICCR